MSSDLRNGTFGRSGAVPITDVRISGLRGFMDSTSASVSRQTIVNPQNARVWLLMAQEW